LRTKIGILESSELQSGGERQGRRGWITLLNEKSLFWHQEYRDRTLKPLPLTWPLQCKSVR